MHQKFFYPDGQAGVAHSATGSGAAMPAPRRPLIEQISDHEFPAERFIAGLKRVFELAEELDQTMTEAA